MRNRNDVTFAELPIGAYFEWRDTTAIQHGPHANTRGPMRKTAKTRYDWSKGYGFAEAHYPVRRVGVPEAQP